MNKDGLTYNNYSAHFNNLMYLEECQMRIDIQRYTMGQKDGVQMMKDSRTGLFRLEVGETGCVM